MQRIGQYPSLLHLSGRRQRLLSAGRHHRQVIGSYIDKNGRKHKKQADPETPIMMRTFPVRTTVMMALIHGMQLFSGVHSCLQIKNGKARGTENASETSWAADSAGCPCLALNADQGRRRLRSEERRGGKEGRSRW